jgi:hypothetical protein
VISNLDTAIISVSTTANTALLLVTRWFNARAINKQNIKLDTLHDKVNEQGRSNAVD